MSVFNDHVLHIWDADSGTCLRTLRGHSDDINSAVFSHDSTWLVSGSRDRTVKIWNTSSGECLQTLDIGAVPRVHDISLDSTVLYVHLDFGTIALDITSDSNVVTSPRYHGVALSQDGQWITLDSEDIVRLPAEYRPSPWCAAVSGRTIAVGVGSGRVWMCTLDTS